MASKTQIQEVISSFSCEKDPDIVDFLNNKAILFEGLSKSKTYFLFTEDEPTKDEYGLMAYFSLALQVL